MPEAIARARFHKKKKVNWGRRSRLKKSALLTLPETWLIWCEAPATQVGMQPVSAGLGAPRKRDCSWSLLSILQQQCKEKNWVAEATEELVGEQQGRNSPDQRLLRAVAERRGASAKRSLTHPSIHACAHHPSIQLFIHWFIDS